MSSTQLVPWIAIFLSILSLVVSVYRVYRDRSRLYAFCQIVYDESQAPENPPPILKIFAVNRGLRPITLTDFGLQVSGKNACWTPLKPEPFETDEEGRLVGIPQNLSHDVGIKMADGDIYEMRIGREDYERLYSANHNYEEAKRYCFRDVLGKKYFVKDSKKGIQGLFA